MAIIFIQGAMLAPVDFKFSEISVVLKPSSNNSSMIYPISVLTVDNALSMVKIAITMK